jgi:hypothetical protein
MVLLAGIALGLTVGLGRSVQNRVPYEAPVLRHLWLVPVAFLLQLWEQSVAFPILASQLVFLAFAFLNRAQHGMSILLLGAVLNFLVMSANGGYMPISPQTASRLFPQENMWDVPAGTLFGVKDILLPPEDTRFEWLADRFLPPAWLPYQFAFSLGDVFIAAGAFWLLAFPKNQSIQKGQIL